MIDDNVTQRLQFWFDSGMPAAQALPMAVAALGPVPAGWQSVMAETVSALIAARTAEREFSMRFLTVEIEEGALVFDMPCTDGVLDGISRRCRVRSLCTCQLCGRRGRLRRFGMAQAAALCARCAAPELLHRSIEDADEFAGIITHGGRVNSVDRIPAVLRRAFLQATGAETARGATMSRADFRAWLTRLREMQRTIPRPHLVMG